MYKPNDAIAEEFITSSSTGAAVNADALPTAALVKNGVDDGAVTLTVTNVDAGRYKITGTIPSGYAAGDKIQIAVSATVGGIAAKTILALGVLDSKRNADMNDLAATAIVSGGAITTSGGAVSNVTTVGTVNGLAADSVNASALAASAVAEIQAGLSTLDAAGVRAALGLALANLDSQFAALPTAAENFTATATTALTESYAADGAAPTLAQAIFLIQQRLTEFAISGTTITTKKLDGSTTAATFTLDSATAPTSSTRAS